MLKEENLPNFKKEKSMLKAKNAEIQALQKDWESATGRISPWAHNETHL